MSTSPVTPSSPLLLRPADYAYRALRHGSRRRPTIGTLRQLHGDLRVKGEHLTVTRDAAPTAPIAYWTAEAKGGKRSHRIVLADTHTRVIDQPAAKTSHRLHLIFGRELLRHESYHARLTLDGFATPQAMIDSIIAHGVNFDSFNIFEDARIEAAARRSPTDGREFGWRRFWVLTDTDKPDRLFWSDITNESAVTERTVKWLGTARTKHPDTKRVWGTTDLIHDFYRRACDAPNVAALLPIVAEWQRVFGVSMDPTTPTRNPNAPGCGYSTTTSDSSQPAPTTYSPEYERKVTPAKTNAEVPLKYFQRELLRRSAEGPSFPQEVSRIEQTFRRLVSLRDGAKHRTGLSGGRLHVRNAITCEPTSFRRTLQRGGKRKVLVLFDMSSSMASHFSLHGGAFLEALHNLNRRGDLDATLICTGGDQWSTIPANASPRDLRLISPKHGCESVKQTLDENKQRVIAADTVLVYTDGHLTDGAVNAGAWRSVGVDLLGICADTQPAVRVQMERHFGRVITAGNGYALAVSVLEYLTRH